MSTSYWHFPTSPKEGSPGARQKRNLSQSMTHSQLPGKSLSQLFPLYRYYHENHYCYYLLTSAVKNPSRQIIILVFLLHSAGMSLIFFFWFKMVFFSFFMESEDTKHFANIIVNVNPVCFIFGFLVLQFQP